MKRILYLTNIEAPYRVRFFNALAEHCRLTVAYERRSSSNRDADWLRSEGRNHEAIFLDGRKIGGENSFTFRIISLVRQGWDLVIVGCFNSPMQIMAMQAMRLLGIPYALNFDGEQFFGTSLKDRIKRLVVGGASAYIIAGNEAARNLKAVVGDKPIFDYPFSSLSRAEVERNAAMPRIDGGFVLVVGQYENYKGLDIAIEVARRDPNTHYKFIGTGRRTEEFCRDRHVPDNVEVIPFLAKPKLEEQYRSARMLVLPSRRECWGLVVNEAASFGTPIVATRGSGAAVEFLANDYLQYLAEPDSVDSLARCVSKCLTNADETYSEFLRNRSRRYTIEASVDAHISLIGTYR